MSWIFGIITASVLLGIGWGWFYFIRGQTLPPASDVREIAIYYSENIGDLLPDEYQPKEFVLKNAEEIGQVIKRLEGILISRVPLMDSDDMDEGPNWILNIYFENGGFRFITVDKKHVSGSVNKNSMLYQYLNDHYT
ncbi:MAG: hypothetical protein K0U72_04645 [Gammaproteobacteria bacterium]|nr:hypothetical protein [Gammaproteobacteria bacterium]